MLDQMLLRLVTAQDKNALPNTLLEGRTIAPLMDLEGFTKRGLLREDPEIKSKLISLIREVKRIPEDKALILAEAVLEE
ncbi:MAG: hypothetical protein WCG94_06515, partial [Methanothrix sp.]